MTMIVTRIIILRESEQHKYAGVRMKQRRHVPSAVFDIRRQLRRKIKSYLAATEETEERHAGIQLRERSRLDIWGSVVECFAATNAGEHEADRIAAVRWSTTRNAEPL